MLRSSLLTLAVLVIAPSPLLAGGFQTGQRSRTYDNQHRETVIDGTRTVNSFVESRVSWEGIGRSEQMVDEMLIDLRGVYGESSSGGAASAGDALLEASRDGFRDPVFRLRNESIFSSAEFTTSGSELNRVTSQVSDRYTSVDRIDERGEQSGSFVSSF